MTTGERDGLDEAAQEERVADSAPHLPMKRMGAMDDIADAVLFLASDEASYVTGQELIVDGGYVVR